MLLEIKSYKEKKEYTISLLILMTDIKNIWGLDFPGGAVVKNPPANAGDTRSSPGPGRSHMLQSN